MPWRTVALAPLVVVLVAAICFVPALTRQREVIEATPQPPPLFTAVPIELLLGREVCSSPILMDAHTDVARVIGLRYADGPPTTFLISVRAPGYSVSKRLTGYADGGALDLALPDPPRPVDAELCVQNYGDVAGMVAGSAEPRTWGRTQSVINGQPGDRRLVLTLLREPPSSLAGRLGDVAGHVAALKPGFAPPAVLLILAALVVVGLPVGAALALRLSAVEADRGQPEGGQVERHQSAEH